MKAVLNCFFYFIITSSLYADNNNVKWIPLEPTLHEEKKKTDSNTTASKNNIQVIQNLKIIKNLLDHVNENGGENEKGKNWYSLEPAE